MESAFGIEHGDEIAKFGLPKALVKPVTALGSKMGVGASKAGSSLKPLTANTKVGAKSIGVPTRGATAGTKATSGARAATTGAKQQTGGALRRAGDWMKANPGVTGAAAVGGGAAVGTGYAAGRRRNY